MIDTIKIKNPHLSWLDLSADEFREYGKVLTDINVQPLIEWASKHIPITPDVVYEPSVAAMERLPVRKELDAYCYAEMPCEIGYCAGNNSFLNGLEYHKGVEINVAITDLVLLLGRVQDIRDDRYDANLVKAAFIPKGSAIELLPTTLHFAPAQVTEEGFATLVILPQGTNRPLDQPSIRDKHPTLFAKNKWLLAHADSRAAKERGAWVGIDGENLQVYY